MPSARFGALIQADLARHGACRLVHQTSPPSAASTAAQQCVELLPTPAATSPKRTGSTDGQQHQGPCSCRSAAPNSRSAAAASSTSRHPRRPADEKLRRLFRRQGRLWAHQVDGARLAPKCASMASPGPIMCRGDSNFDEVSRQRIVSHTMLKRAGDPTTSPRGAFLRWITYFVTGRFWRWMEAQRELEMRQHALAATFQSFTRYLHAMSAVAYRRQRRSRCRLALRFPARFAPGGAKWICSSRMPSLETVRRRFARILPVVWSHWRRLKASPRPRNNATLLDISAP